MTDLLIDTNIYSYALRGTADVVSVLRKAHSIGISSVSIGELLYGFKGGSKERQNIEELEDFLDSPRVQIYCVDENTAEFYAEILSGLKTRGTPIPTNDIWIAAVAFQHGLKLFTRDRHFEKIAGIVML